MSSIGLSASSWGSCDKEQEAIAAGRRRADDIQRLRENVLGAIEQLTSGTPKQVRGLILACVTTIDLHPDELRLSAHLGSVDPLLGDAAVTTPVNSVRSRQLKLVIPAAGEAEASCKNPALIKLVTQAIAAREMITNSLAAEFDGLAREIGYSREHAANLLKVAFLAPDIIGAILDGRQLRGLIARSSPAGRHCRSIGTSSARRWGLPPFDGFGVSSSDR